MSLYLSTCARFAVDGATVAVAAAAAAVVVVFPFLLLLLIVGVVWVVSQRYNRTG